VERHNRPYHAARPLLSYDEEDEEEGLWPGDDLDPQPGTPAEETAES
jgi:hypothetical protein